MNTPIDIVLAGVGGQGSVLATAVIARAAVLAELPVVTSEVHGMSQRGGVVVTAVRVGRGDAAPRVPEGGADFLVAFEPLEALRHLEMLRPGGVAIVAEDGILPSVEALRDASYPEDPAGLMTDRGVRVVSVPADGIARELGHPRLAGTVLLGVLSLYLDLPVDAWRGAIAQTVPVQTLESNFAALARGAEWRILREKAVTAF
ncbi:MAG TPA: indolepyruvate oxidoreductase subunit beta [Longimicrobiales bacterium]|nr:indolepyruvate oxidoreductase subunit beta [Longimicrobiales bacterium]